MGFRVKGVVQEGRKYYSLSVYFLKKGKFAPEACKRNCILYEDVAPLSECM